MGFRILKMETKSKVQIQQQHSKQEVKQLQEGLQNGYYREGRESEYYMPIQKEELAKIHKGEYPE